jgi:hypothetical protein
VETVLPVISVTVAITLTEANASVQTAVACKDLRPTHDPYYQVSRVSHLHEFNLALAVYLTTDSEVLIEMPLLANNSSRLQH